MDVIYRNIEEYNPNKKRKISIFLDHMIADILSNKKLNPKVSHFPWFYYTILFCCAKKSYTEFYALFYYKTSK